MGHTPKQLGDFEILRELGRGGMGVVYEAKQKSLNRRVALKVLSTGLGLTTKAVMRFKREAEAAAKLHHTNIVPIYSTGEENRIPYYAMELIDGPSLDQVIRQFKQDASEPPPAEIESTHDFHGEQSPSEISDWVADTIGLGKPESDGAASSSTSSVSGSSSITGVRYYDKIARMTAEVADALAHAHDLGVIHRDIKPSNLLLSADGRLSVNDFGLARMLEQPGMTISGELMGSPMYMSPEQIAAGRLPLDHRTDIYSLGATLYEMLTLRPPSDGRQRDQVLSQIVHKEPVRPRSVNKRIPRDLETVCLKAMEKDPDRRYQTADTLADDLRRFADRHAISARRVGPLERGVRWAHKNKALTAMACLTLSVIVGAVLLAYVSQRTQRRKDFQQKAIMAAMSGNLDNAKEYIQEAMDYGADAEWMLMISAQVELFDGQNGKAIDYIKLALDQNPAPTTRTTAKAMLADAYIRNGDYPSYLQIMNELDAVDDIDTESRIFRARALIWNDPQRAVSILIAATKDPTYRITFAILANARAMHALDLRDRNIVQDALKDANVAMSLLEDNPIAHAAQLFTRLAAVEIDPEHKADYLAGAETNVEYLSHKAPGYLRGPYLIGHYYVARRKYNEAIRFMEEQFAGKETVGYAIAPFVMAAVESENPMLMDSVESLLNNLKEPSATEQCFHVLMLLGMKDKDGNYRVEDASKVMDGLMKDQMNELSYWNAATNWLFPGGDIQVKKWATNDKESESAGFYQKVREYMAGDLGNGPEADDTLRKQAGQSARYLGEAHYYIGLRKLSRGEREGAWASFDASDIKGCGVLWAGSHESRIFKFYRKDSTWPNWLPTGSVNSQAN